MKFMGSEYKKKMAEYIWIGGGGELRSKTKVVENEDSLSVKDYPLWNFDGSSTEQSTANSSDLILRPSFVCEDKLRGWPHKLVMCEVLDNDYNPIPSNYRNSAAALSKEYEHENFWFGMEQEYTLMSKLDKEKRIPLGLAHLGYENDYPEQGPFYCGIGYDKSFGRKIAEEHMRKCLDSKLLFCGMNAEVMPGQWEFQIGPGAPLLVADTLWIARYLLLKIAEEYGAIVSFDAKPHPNLNGAGCHTNFSTEKMRGNLKECISASAKLGMAITKLDCVDKDVEYSALSFPSEYGTGYKERLTGACETCSWEQFKFGVADRTASVRIPLQVFKDGKGYIEDRRPCADIDPYRVVSYVMNCVGVK
jgi:glutamine synthetase